MAHSVSDHLHVMIADYDRFIRTVIPHYETMRAVQLELLARCLPSDGRVIDLGGGTGALARAVAEKFPGVRVEIWDTDPAMLEVARERCAAFGDRVHFVERSFAEPLPACDAVVACIALHHVKLGSYWATTNVPPEMPSRIASIPWTAFLAGASKNIC